VGVEYSALVILHCFYVCVLPRAASASVRAATVGRDKNGEG